MQREVDLFEEICMSEEFSETITAKLASSKKKCIQELKEFQKSPIPEKDFNSLVKSIIAQKSKIDAVYNIALEYNEEIHGINLHNYFGSKLLKMIHSSAL